jgi:hypothetical protein
MAAKKSDVLEKLIERLESQLAVLNTEHEGLLDQLTADPSLLDKQGARSPAVAMSDNRTQAAALEQQLSSMRERLDDARAEEDAAAIRDRNAAFKDATHATAKRVLERVRQRTSAARAADKAIAALGAALSEIEELNRAIVQDAGTVARLAYSRQDLHAGMRELGSASQLRDGCAGGALLSRLMDAGVGTRGVKTDLVYGTISTTIHPNFTMEGAMEQAEEVSRRLVESWLHTAFGPSDISPDVKLRVRARKEGFDGLMVRSPGEVFDIILGPGDVLGTWLESAEGEELDKPEPKGATLEQLRATYPGSKVHLLRA